MSKPETPDSGPCRWRRAATAPEDGTEFEYCTSRDGRVRTGSLGHDMGGSIKRDPDMTWWRWPPGSPKAIVEAEIAADQATTGKTKILQQNMVTDKSETTGDVPYTARLDAGAWWDKHKPHVDRLIASRDDGSAAYPPSGSDRFHPELWRAPHWRWLKGTLNNV